MKLVKKIGLVAAGVAIGAAGTIAAMKFRDSKLAENKAEEDVVVANVVEAEIKEELESEEAALDKEIEAEEAEIEEELSNK